MPTPGPCSSPSPATWALFPTSQASSRLPTATTCPSSSTRPGERTSVTIPDLPPNAMALGADAMVTSIHKLLPGIHPGEPGLRPHSATRPDRLDWGFEAGAHHERGRDRCWRASTPAGHSWKPAAQSCWNVSSAMSPMPGGACARRCRVSRSPTSTLSPWSLRHDAPRAVALGRRSERRRDRTPARRTGTSPGAGRP